MTPEQVEEAIQYAQIVLTWRATRYEESIFCPEIQLCLCSSRDSTRDTLISLALDGWETGHFILCEMARVLTQIGDPLPLWLQEYVVVAAKNGGPRRPKKGRDPLANLVRDVVIAEATGWVCDRFKLRPMRSPASTTECGCSIVAKALEDSGAAMSEANVAAIWANQRRARLVDRLRRRRTSEARREVPRVNVPSPTPEAKSEPKRRRAAQ